MLIRILLYFGLLAVGWMLSSKGLIHEKMLNKISHIQGLFLFILIFIMGIRLGMDDKVIASIGQIGLKAAAFALLTGGFSVLFVFIARKKLIHEKNITGGKAND